jgi:hypothetical protein
MKFTTTIRAVDPLTGDLKTYFGPYIEAISWDDAEKQCREKLGYCRVHGILVAEIPTTKENGNIADWDKMIDYETIKLN